MPKDTPDQAVVKRPVGAVNWVWAAIGLATLAAAPFLLWAAGSEEVTVRNLRPWGPETETYAWAGPAYVIAAILGYATLRTLFLFFRDTAVVTDAEGIGLRGDGRKRARWGEVERVVFWNRTVRRFGLTRRRTYVGVVRASARTSNFTRAAAAKTWTEHDVRDNGVPEWLPGGIQKHSVRLPFSRARLTAEAVHRFAPQIPVTDERTPGPAKPIT